MLTRRQMLKLGGAAAASAALPAGALALGEADYSLDIAPYSLQISAKHTIKTIAYNQQVPGPLLRLKEGRPATIDVTNRTGAEEIVHWHGLFLPSDVDGAMEEGTPMIPAGGKARYAFTPRPVGFRWYHTHTAAGNDLRKSQYTGQHGFLMIERPGAGENPGGYDREFFLALHDWDGQLQGSGDGSMNPSYDFATINGKVLGFGEPLRVKHGERALLHILNSSATEPHWLSFSGHQFRVIALDGNAVPAPRTAPMLRLAPAERVCAVVEMDNPGAWVLGEVRRHIQAAGMGIVVEYAGSSFAGRWGKPVWRQPESLDWDYGRFSGPVSGAIPLQPTEGLGGAPGESLGEQAIAIPLVFEAKFAGHGALDHWMINGKSYPNTETVTLREGRRYRLQFINRSTDDHPVHLHRHSFELRSLPQNALTRGIMKDVVLVGAGTRVDVEFMADNPGLTLFHCHQQDHMDMGFMMLFRYA